MKCRSIITPYCCTGRVELVKHSFLNQESKADFKEGEGEVELVHFVEFNSKNLALKPLSVCLRTGILI